MKKLAFLLAIVAVFAMSAAAFAGDPTTVTGLYAPDNYGNATIVQTSPASKTATGTAYYLAGTTPSLDIALKVAFNESVAGGVTTVAVVSGEIVNSGKEPSVNRTPCTFMIGPKHTDYAKDIALEIGARKNDGTFLTTTSGDLKITPKSVDISTSGDVELSFTDSVAEKKVVSLDIPEKLNTSLGANGVMLGALDTDMKKIISADLTDTATTPKTFVLSGVSFDLAKDAASNQWALTAESGASAAPGEYTLAFIAKKDAAVIDKAKIAGMTGNAVGGTDYVLLAKIPFKVEAGSTPDPKPDPTPDPTPADIVVEIVSADQTNPEVLKATTNKADDPDAIAIVADAGVAVGSDGRLTAQTVVDAIDAAGESVLGTNIAENVKPLPIVSSDIKDRGKIATIIFTPLKGTDFVSSDAEGRVVNVRDLNIMKIVASDDVTRLPRAGSVAGKSAAELDGTFNVCWGGEIVDSVNSKSDDYELRVYIMDDEHYDFNKPVTGNVVDPIAIVKSTGSGDGGSSSGACTAGAAAMIALIGLAAMKRRR